MHMADALLSPAVGGTMWAATAGLIAYSSKKVKENFDDRKVPLMGVLGAFIFAAQMINFTIPGTGSSGHLGGGMILSILLGSHAAFLTIASILFIQALFFADGGLLALGCNIFNLGFLPAFLAYPLVYKKVAGPKPTQARVALGATLAAVVGLQLGSFGVVLETFLSGVSDLPLGAFALLMQPIHLAIGFIEGLVTTAVVVFIRTARPEIFGPESPAGRVGNVSTKKVLVGILAVTVLTGGVLSWFASSHPDGLEWSMFRTAGKEDIGPEKKGIHDSLQKLQDRTAILPDYAFKSGEKEVKKEGEWPAVEPGTTVSGLVGGAMTLIVAVLIGFALKRRKKSP
jgi:cobalt/nickel transport system permease protein